MTSLLKKVLPQGCLLVILIFAARSSAVRAQSIGSTAVREQLANFNQILPGPSNLMGQPGLPGGTPAWWDPNSAAAGQTLLDQSLNASKFNYKVVFATGFVYDDNIYVSDTNKVGSAFFVARPALTVNYGDPSSTLNFSLLYTPEYEAYTNHNVSSVFDENGRINVGLNGSRSRLLASMNYAYEDGSNIDVGQRVQSSVFQGSLTGSYDISPKTTLGASLSFQDAVYQSLDSDDTYTGLAYLDWHIDPKLDLGVSLDYAKDVRTETPEQDTYGARVRFRWNTGSKLAIAGNLGFEFLSWPGGSAVEPAGNITVSYAATAKSSLHLDIYAGSTASALSGNDYQSTGIAFGASQQLLNKFSIDFTTGYEHASYRGIVADAIEDAVAGRIDNIVFIRPSIRWAPFKSLSFNLFYTFTYDGSNLAINTVQDQQVGIYVTFTF